MTTLTGNCVECGFPIALKEIGHPVSCPFCTTENLPIKATVSNGTGGFSISPTTLLVGTVVVIGVLVLAAKGRR